MTRLFVMFLGLVLLIAGALLLPVVAHSHGFLPHGTADLFAMLVMWPRSQLEYAFLVAAWVGVYGHFRNKRRLGEVIGNFVDYLLAERVDQALSIATAILIWAVIMGLISTGQVANAHLAGAVVGGLGVGWTIDSLIQARQ